MVFSANWSGITWPCKQAEHPSFWRCPPPSQAFLGRGLHELSKPRVRRDHALVAPAVQLHQTMSNCKLQRSLGNIRKTPGHGTLNPVACLVMRSRSVLGSQGSPVYTVALVVWNLRKQPRAGQQEVQESFARG